MTTSRTKTHRSWECHTKPHFHTNDTIKLC